MILLVEAKKIQHPYFSPFSAEYLVHVHAYLSMFKFCQEI